MLATSVPEPEKQTSTNADEHLAKRENVFRDLVSFFQKGMAQLLPDDWALDEIFQNFIQNAKMEFQHWEQKDEEKIRVHNEWTMKVYRVLGFYEEQQTQDYVISFRFVHLFNEFLSLLHPNSKKDRLRNLGIQQCLYQAKLTLIKFEAKLQYYRRCSYDAHDAIDDWRCETLTESEEKFKKEQLNASNWTIFKSIILQLETVEPIDAVYKLMKSLQQVYKDFEERGSSKHCLQYLRSAIWSLARLVQTESEIQRETSEAERALCELVGLLSELVDFWAKPTFDSKKIISRLKDFWAQEDFEEERKKSQLMFRHLLIHSFNLKECSIGMFSHPDGQKASDETRGHSVLRFRMKRLEDCFYDIGYDLLKFWRDIKESKAINLRDAYSVFDHESKKPETKGGHRKISGPLKYYIMNSDKDAMNFQKLHLAWTLPSQQRQEVFQRMCPTLAELQSDNLTDKQDAERRILRQRLLLKKKPLVIRAKNDAEKRKMQKNEELMEYLCSSENWSGPLKEFDNNWLEKLSEGSWSFAQQKAKDPALTEKEMWFQQTKEALKMRCHLFFALEPEKKEKKEKAPKKQKSKKKRRRLAHSPHRHREAVWLPRQTAL